MQNSFISMMTKAVTKWKPKSGRNTLDKSDVMNYYDAVRTPDLQEIDAVVRSKIQDEISDFFSATSFTALTQIYKADSLWKRVVWIVLVIVMLVWMTVQCIWLLQKYYSYPTEVKIDMKVATRLEFPSVTICNMNPILENKVAEKPYRALIKYVDPEISDLLYQELKSSWQFEGDCKSKDYRCKNGWCVPDYYECDGYPDCEGEGEDEKGCGDYQCLDGYWKCTNPPICIFAISRCNGQPGDCNVNTTEDEDNCEDYKCSDEYWKCTNPPKCIYLVDRCNGRPDGCSFNNTEDEDNCENNTCPAEWFRCNSGKCIPDHWVCDKVEDCQGPEDEMNCPVSNTTGLGENAPSEMELGVSFDVSSVESNTQFLHSATTNFSTITPSRATDTFRKKRAARADDVVVKDRQLKDRHRMYRKPTGTASNIPRDNNAREVKAKREIIKGRNKRGEFINHLYNSYKAYEESEVLNNKHTRNTWYTETRETNKEHRRRKRQAQSEQSENNERIKVDWKSVLANSTFNKWLMLNNTNMASNFYDEFDDEYEASMTYAYLTAKLDPQEVEKSGHGKYDLIAACKFGAYQCSPQNFTYLHSHKFGNCYTFNSKFGESAEQYTKFPGPENGLRLELFVDQDNYVANLATEAGVRILVHKKGSMPFPEDEGISVLPGRSTSIGIRQVSLSRLPPPHGVCAETGKTADYYSTNLGTDYSKLACLKSCYQDLIIKHCHCAVPFYYILDNVTICNMTDKVTEICVDNLFHKYSESFETCNTLCPVPCLETRYEMTISAANWPSQKYETYLQQRLGQTNYLYLEAPDSEKEFVKLQIYFQDLIYEHVEQQKAYESMNLISDLGGQLGLWLGLSAITIGEICSFLFGVGASLSYKCRWNKSSPANVENDLTPNTTIQPATLQEMYEDMCPEVAKYERL